MGLEDDIDAELAAAGKEFDKDAEIERILAAFRLNAYEVLELQPGVPSTDIKKVYRTKSLLIHPDKTPNPRAPDAFDRLAKAEQELQDEKKRAILDEYIADARMLAMREMKLTKDDTEAMQTEEFKKLWLQKQRFVIVDETRRLQRQQAAQLREEGRQQRKEEEEAAERKRKREQEDAWEKTRDERINSWRDFASGKKKAPASGAGGAKEGDAPKKKKVKKVKTLG